MPHVLLIGYAPDAVDYSDPTLPPGIDAGKIAAGIDAGLKQMRDKGWQTDFCAIRPNESITETIEQQLTSVQYDCIVIGGGVRMSSRYLNQFEMVINAVRENAPGVPIAFNTRPEDSADAAERWISTQ
ncbi:hypothetical protein [Methylobacterium sp. GC_Met_2]|uniref:hypothetical protein n=1 Tax=Methylobacterium sp. GC_Met_2 TaxID=2937376 RepID=UPI00226B4B28|nr:hypothetical protein [Methylobacterium sp. GC_Met_2]